MKSYDALGRFYDSLIEYPYSKVADLVSSKCKGVALDLFCGTGRFSVELASRGFSVQGSDLSAEMLNYALINASRAGYKLIFKQENALDFAYNCLYDVITATSDGLNYIAPDKAAAFINRVHSALKAGGLFVFDISTAYKLRKVLGNNLFFEDLEGLSYFWRNKQRKSDNSVKLELSFFELQKDGSYRRYDEEQRQFIYETAEVLRLCEKCGFTIINTLDLDTFFAPADKSQRVLFILKK